jgi:tRNA threonylcarbamoyladenosine biosynthesis protein TsaB
VLLSIDTSSPIGGLSLFKNQKLVAETFWGTEKSHSETLTQEFQNLINKFGFASSEISEVLCAHGPGSFTGLRVGLNFAKSISYVNKLQLILTPSYRSYLDPTNNSDENLKTIVLLNAFKNQIFLAEYMFSDQKISEILWPTIITPEEIMIRYKNESQIQILGDGFETYESLFDENFKKKCIFANLKNINPSLRQAELYFKYDHCLKFTKVDPLLAEPLYIKKSEAEENLNRGQLKRHTQRKL